MKARFVGKFSTKAVYFHFFYTLPKKSSRGLTPGLFVFSQADIK